MFCNRCGAQLKPDYRVCPQCGNVIQGQVVPGALPGQGRVARHLKTLAVLWMIVAGVWLIPGFGLLVAGSVSGIFIPMGTILAEIWARSYFTPQAAFFCWWQPADSRWDGDCCSTDRGRESQPLCWELSRCFIRRWRRPWEFTRFGCCSRRIQSASSGNWLRPTQTSLPHHHLIQAFL